MPADIPHPAVVPPAELRARPPRTPPDAAGGAGKRWRDLVLMAATAVVSAAIAVFVVHRATTPHAALAPPPVASIAAPYAASAPPDATIPTPQTAAASPRTVADFGSVTPTPSARHMADWVVGRHDNGKLPFVVLDKRDARLYVFQPDGRLIDQTPVLLGSSHGDDTYPGIGDVPIDQVKPYQRTTAAGRFVTRPGLDADHTDVVWLDYDAALAMHRVINKVKAEHRLEHLASPNPAQRRISWGCINIPIDFFDRYVSPVFGKHSGVAYVIPERKRFAEVFENPGASASVQTAAQTALAPRDISER